jgi:hypothetical protein
MQIAPEQMMWEWEDMAMSYVTPPSSGKAYPSVGVGDGEVGVKFSGGILVGTLGVGQPPIGKRVKITVELIDG